MSSSTMASCLSLYPITSPKQPHQLNQLKLSELLDTLTGSEWTIQIRQENGLNLIAVETRNNNATKCLLEVTCLATPMRAFEPLFRTEQFQSSKGWTMPAPVTSLRRLDSSTTVVWTFASKEFPCSLQKRCIN